MLTNSLVPCNGRFPALISIITMFFVVSQGALGSLTGALFLTLVISLGIGMTFAVSKLLSHTFLKGEPSSFALELPPYRKPQFFHVLVRSVFDSTLFMLARAVAVAAPAGLVIWLMANVTVGESTLLLTCSEFLDPLGKLLGLDGVILMAFILGFPANEIVIPLMLMAYMSNSSVVRIDDISVIKQVLLDNGWTLKTAICTTIFTLFHWPCSTTVLSIKKETGSLKWTALSILIPTIVGVLLCVLVNIIG
jgi:ferrous iron transport protein B